METDSASKTPLTLEGDYDYVSLTEKGDSVYYRRHKKHPANPVFGCHLDHEITQKLITDPGSIMLRKPKKTIFFWPRTLMHGIRTDGQFVFETFPPQDTNNKQIKVAVRTLFQLDGDILVKIDKSTLARTEGIEILEAHFSWTNWCFEQLKISPSGFLNGLRLLGILLSVVGLCGVYKKMWLLSVLIVCGPALFVLARKIISKFFAWLVMRWLK